MKLIADAGGTTTEWRLINEDRILQYTSDGFNFKTHPIEPFLANLPEEVVSLSTLDELHFYAAGIINESDVQVMTVRFQQIFPECVISVYSDTLGVARAIFGHEKGYACLLGTGSGAAYYDGKDITQRIPSLGYVLGDEGSGFALGKAIVTARVRLQLPKDLELKFDLTFPDFDESELIREVYSKPKPNLKIAGYASFLIENQTSPFAYRLIENVLEGYFQAFFPDQEENSKHQFRFCGSIAHYSSNILRRIAPKHNVKIDLIAQSPIAGLALYHKNHE
ncbi:MAG: hypothetical protein JXR10_10450 [Cyclobacteriaceae bacterium]